MKIMKTATEKRIAFRENLKSGHIMIAPGVGDALGAKIAEMAGIPALAMGGYSVSASRLGQPDVGNALNIIRTEQMFEQAGAACIFFEDQAWPKRCGHMEGKQVIAAEEHAQKIRAAVDARFDKETMIMSRTDSRAVYGIDDAIERSKRYADAGAEICFADGIGSCEELEKFARGLEGSGAYLVANMIEGGKTPLIPAKELEEMGYSVVFWACSAVYAISKTLYDLFTDLKEKGTTEDHLKNMIEFGHFNSIIGLDTYKELERKYKVDRDD